MPTDRSAFGAFLRSRRDRLTPAAAGITPTLGPRRVPGLRKEELAALAGLSPDHYSRLEQGRQHTVTDEIVDALARALQLDPLEHAHLRNLAAPVRRHRAVWEPPQRPDPGLLRVMTVLDHVPALLIGRRSQILACNRLLRTVLGAELQPGSALAHWLFLDPRARERIENWSDYAAAAVGALRYEAGHHPGDARLRTLIGELRAADPDAARWWDDHGVTDRTSVDKHIAHPLVGTLTFAIEALSSPHDPWQRLVVYTTEPHSPTHQALSVLASWGPNEPGDLPPEATAPRAGGQRPR